MVQSSLAESGADRSETALIPKPLKVTAHEGHFDLTAKTKIVIPPGSEELRTIAEGLSVKLRRTTGYEIQVVVSSELKQVEGCILLTNDVNNKRLGKEGYELSVSASTIRIAAATPAGLFYGVQTLYQLMPAEIEGSEKAVGVNWTVPCVTIEDSPRFRWRGMHLDVGRHFAPKEFIKKYIDMLAMYKLNTFHWHLTEDQGWRIEIKKYPRLMEISSWRRETTGNQTPHWGYYTQEEIREVVEYAKKRFITIVPEIEMPGHSQAALAGYPELSCSGGPHRVATEWGVFNDVYCAGNEKTFEFLENVLTEVMALFPGEYIHIGGDECPKARWKNCKRCQDRIVAEKLKDEHELQSYFIRRIEKFLNSKGKRIVGWDEILEGGLAPNATVMSWRGIEGGIKAAKSGHDVVMSPTSNCYFDYSQGKFGEPKAIGAYLPIEKVYSYEPVPTELSKEEALHILGAQGNVWTEYMPDSRQVEYMLMPRMCALSEVVWSSEGQRDFHEFSLRLESHYDRLAKGDVNFRVPTPTGIGGNTIIHRDTLVSLICPVSKGEVRYTLDGSVPTKESTIHASPIKISSSQTVKARTFLPNGRMSYTVTGVFSKIDPERNGLNFKYFEGEWLFVPKSINEQPLKTGRVYKIGLDEIEHRIDYYAVQLDGYIHIERDGEYAFYLSSDDGSKLSIDGTEVVNGDRMFAWKEANGKIELKRGKHSLSIVYFQTTGGQRLDVMFEGPQVEKQAIPAHLLFSRQ
jgi:hexosaminidase